MRKKIVCLLFVMVMVVSGAALAAGDADEKTAVQLINLDAHHWDPAKWRGPEPYVMLNAYERLVKQNVRGAEPQLLPWLATSWDKAADNMSWTFKLRKGVKFHDGEPFNAAAVKACLDRSLKIGIGATSVWEDVKEILVVDEYKVKFNLKKPAPLDKIASSIFGTAMYSAKAVKKGLKPGQTAGTGPYKGESYLKAQQAVFSKFDDYWRGWDGKHFDRVVIKIVLEPTTHVQMLRSGEADLSRSVIPNNIIEPLKSAEGIEVSVADDIRSHMIFMNHKKFPTDNRKIREAIWYAFNYDAAIKNINSGYAKPARGVIPASVWGHNSDLETGRFDLAKARKLVEESGIPKNKLKLVYSYVKGSAGMKEYGEMLQAALAQIGIKLTIKGAPFFVSWSRAKKLETAPNLYATMMYSLYPSPKRQMRNMFGTEKRTHWNLSYYSNPEYDRLLNEAIIMEGVDLPKAAVLYKKAQKMLVDDKPTIFVCDVKDVVVKRKSVKGFVHNPYYQNDFSWYDMYRGKD